MSAGREVHALVGPVRAVQRLLERAGNRGVIIGGVAVSLLARPRLTADVDAVLLASAEDLPQILGWASEEGLLPRIPDALDFARTHRVLLLRHQESEISVDISLGILPFEMEMVERSQVHEFGGFAVRLPTPEDLIILKAVAHRPVDLADIRAIVQSHPTLDRARIQRWVKAFAEALEMPELWEEIEPLLEPPSGGRDER